MIHILKIDSNMYNAVKEVRKTFEIRKDDRGFKVGDLLILKETRYTGLEMKIDGSPLEFTGNELKVVVQYILRGPIYGLMDGWVIMSIL